MKNVDVDDSSKKTSDSTNEKRRFSLLARAIGFALYSAIVWFSVAKLWISDATVLRTFCVVAVVCVAAELTTFVFSIFWRRRNRGTGIEEPFVGLVGRTGTPCIAALCVVFTCDSNVERPVLLSLVAAYFLTAPVHLWLTFPTEKRD